VLGPVVGGLLVAASGWPAVFWVNVPLCIAVAAVVLLVAPSVAAARRRRGRRPEGPAAPGGPGA
jgi:MFS family permease